jgi:hypothetical protein
MIILAGCSLILNCVMLGRERGITGRAEALLTDDGPVAVVTAADPICSSSLLFH